VLIFILYLYISSQLIFTVLPGAFWMKKDQPTFTLRQVGIICERLLKDYEDKVREEYEQILSTKLAGRLRRGCRCCLHNSEKMASCRRCYGAVYTTQKRWLHAGDVTDCEHSGHSLVLSWCYFYIL
jgi:hypothetical protein